MLRFLCLKIQFCLLIVFFGATLSFRSYGAMDPKMRVLLTTAAYGTAGGALLGTASLAFGANSRTIFQGASLGLYAGLIFGTYILYSHNEYKKGQEYRKGGYPEDADSPYSDEDTSGEYDDVYYQQQNWRSYNWRSRDIQEGMLAENNYLSIEDRPLVSMEFVALAF